MNLHGQRLLLVEDEASLRLTLSDRLESEGLLVTTAEEGEHGLELARGQPWDLIVLDLALPRRDGLEILQELRRAGDATPVLLLTARAQTTDKVVGLKLGADDYLTKPFEVAELLARLEALLRRSQVPSPTEKSSKLTFGNVLVDLDGAEVRVDNAAIDLSQMEFKLLVHLLDRAGKVVSRDELLSDVWGYDPSVYSRTVDVHVASLRQKVEPQPGKPRHIVTVHGRGYKFVREP